MPSHPGEMPDKESRELGNNTALKIVLASVVGLILCAIAVIACLFGSLMYNMTGSDSARALMQSESSDLSVPDSLPSDFYMLLLGVDSSENRQTGGEAQYYEGSFRSDTIIVAHIDLDDKKVALCSLERDIKTLIEGYEDDGYYKFNNAYALGGVPLMLSEAERLTGLDIPYYAVVDMDGMTEIVDVFGGIDIDVERAFWDTQLNDGIDQGGMQTLNGRQAVLYARSRYAWDDGDFSRARHQREVLRALAGKLMSTDDLFLLYATAQTVSNRVATNLTLPQIFEIAAKMRGFEPESDMYSMMTPTDPDYSGGVSYQVIDEEAWEDVLHAFEQFIDPDASTTDDDDRYIDADSDGYYDADANLDGVVNDAEYEDYLAGANRTSANSTTNTARNSG